MHIDENSHPNTRQPSSPDYKLKEDENLENNYQSSNHNQPQVVQTLREENEKQRRDDGADDDEEEETLEEVSEDRPYSDR